MSRGTDLVEYGTDISDISVDSGGCVPNPLVLFSILCLADYFQQAALRRAMERWEDVPRATAGALCCGFIIGDPGLTIDGRPMHPEDWTQTSCLSAHNRVAVPCAAFFCGAACCANPVFLPVAACCMCHAGTSCLTEYAAARGMTRDMLLHHVIERQPVCRVLSQGFRPLMIQLLGPFGPITRLEVVPPDLLELAIGNQGAPGVDRNR
jgi:hypothetical protein